MAQYSQYDERKNLKPKILYLARLSFRIEEDRKSFPDKQKLKEFITINWHYKKKKKVKGNSSIGKEKPKTRNRKINKRKKISLVKANIL